jgi:hypothetical protein
LDERVSPDHAANVLKAATLIRDEVCGPIVKKVEVKMGLAEMLARASIDDDDVVDALTEGLDAAEDLLPDPESRHEKALLPASGAGPGATTLD